MSKVTNSEDQLTLEHVNHAEQFEALRQHVLKTYERMTAGNQPVFMTDEKDLFDIYLSRLPTDDAGRQYHNCQCCRSFMNRYASLVVITDKHVAKSAVWDDTNTDAFPFYARSVQAMKVVAESARIVGVFKSDQHELGRWASYADTDIYEAQDPIWTHFSLEQHPAAIFNTALMSAGQARSKSMQDFKNVRLAITSWPTDVFKKGVQLVTSEAVFRAEKYKAPITWLYELHTNYYTVRKSPNGIRLRDNALWRAIALAPDGFKHPRKGVIGNLLDGIHKGMSTSMLIQNFGKQTDSLTHQRAQTPPSSGNVKRAETIFDKLQLAPALRRRQATLEELPHNAFVWRPRRVWASAPQQRGSVFGHLQTKDHRRDAPVPVLRVTDATTMSFARFQRVVLPLAEAVYMLVPEGKTNFTSINTAADPDAPPILKWDSPAERNPFNWYLYAKGSQASTWNMRAGSWATVTGIVTQPNQWSSGHGYHGTGVIFLLDGCRDTVANGGLALFPDTLKSELHEVRATIEAFSEQGQLEGMEEASAAGLKLSANVKHLYSYELFTVANGVQQRFKIDRFE